MKNQEILKNQTNKKDYYVELASGEFARIGYECDPGSFTVTYPVFRQPQSRLKAMKLENHKSKREIMRCVNNAKHEENENHLYTDGKKKAFQTWICTGRTYVFWVSPEDIYFDSLKIKDTPEGANEAADFYNSITDANGEIRTAIDVFQEKHTYQNKNGHKVPQKLLNAYFEFCEFEERILPGHAINFRKEKTAEALQQYLWFKIERGGDNSVTPYNGKDAIEDVNGMGYSYREISGRLGDLLDEIFKDDYYTPQPSSLREPITKLDYKDYIEVWQNGEDEDEFWDDSEENQEEAA